MRRRFGGAREAQGGGGSGAGQRIGRDRMNPCGGGGAAGKRGVTVASLPEGGVVFMGATLSVRGGRRQAGSRDSLLCPACACSPATVRSGVTRVRIH